MTDSDQTLEQIEGPWGDPPPGATRLIARVHELRRRPVGALGVEDLRVMIAQKVGLETLMPPALTVLERDPMAEGDYYPGDLLVAALRVPAAYWAAHADQRQRLAGVAAGVGPDDMDDELRADIAAFLRA